MKIEQREFSPEKGWKDITSSEGDSNSFQLVLAFGKDTLVKNPVVFESLKQKYPSAQIVIASDGGQIMDVSVDDEGVGITAFHFEKTSISAISQKVNKQTSYEVGQSLGESIPKLGLVHLLVISEGLDINGSALIQGIREKVGNGVSMSGGLAGDDMHFVKTYVGLNSSPSEDSTVVLVGFYGESLKVGLGSIGGWDTFGPKRVITKSEGNTVYEIDGQPALDLYKTYLGEFTKDLPGSGLLFPLSIETKEKDIILVRTLLSVDEEKKSVTYAGDVPQGTIAWLMKANFERVIDGAGQAVKNSLDMIHDADYALLISCVGRRAILKQRVEEELEAIRYILGDATKMSGFYSYGEIGPAKEITSCYLHNQTMTVTLFKEI